MRIVQVGAVSGNVSLTVPTGVSAITAFVSGGNWLDGAAGDSIPRVYLSASPSDTFTLIEGGSSKSVIAIANRNFPIIPVAPGEVILVVSSAFAWTALIYFEEIPS